MPFTLPSLPYAFDALEPHIDTQTMQIHHGKHHQTYVNNLNAAIEKAPELANKTLEELRKCSRGRAKQRWRTLEPLDVLGDDGARRRW